MNDPPRHYRPLNLEWWKFAMFAIFIVGVMGSVTLYKLRKVDFHTAVGDAAAMTVFAVSTVVTCRHSSDH